MKPNLSQKFPLLASVGLHLVLGLLLIMSFERTIFIPAIVDPSQQKEPIDAVIVSSKSLQDEVDRLAMQEAKKKQQEQAKRQELIRKEAEAKQKLAELKQKKEQLKKEAEQQLLAKAKQEQEALQLIEKEKAEKIEKAKAAKAEKEAKEVAAKKKAIEDQKAQELVKQQELAKEKEKEKLLAEQNAKQAQSMRVKQDQISQYAMMMRNKIHQHWRQPLGMNFNDLTCKVEVQLMPTGDVIGVVIRQSSGSVEFDRSAELAIQKASPLPMPADTEVAKEFRQFTFTFRPEAA